MSTILDLAALVDTADSNTTSNLNANAPVFVPSGSSTPNEALEAAHAESPLTEQWFEGDHFLPPSWMGQYGQYEQQYEQPQFYAAPQYYMPQQILDTEDTLRDALYRPPQKAKGSTVGRARHQSYAGALMQA